MSTNENYLRKNLKDDNDSSVWRIIKNTQYEDIIANINHKSNDVKTHLNILLDESKRDKIHKRTKIISSNLKKNSSESMLFEKEISTNSKILLSKIGKHIKYIKKSTNEISKLNEIFLERPSNNESNIQNNNLQTKEY